jgi:hypothetical protein
VGTAPRTDHGRAELRRGGHHRSLHIIRNFGPRCRTGGPPRLFRRSPRNHPAYVNYSPGSSGRGGPFRLKFGWPVVAHRNLDHCRRRSGACALRPSLSASRLCDAGGVGHAQRLAAPQLLSRSPPQASRAGSLPKVPALKRSTLHAGSKHAEIVLKWAENTRKTVDWLVTFASISPSQRPCAYVGKAGKLMNPKIEFRGRARVASAAVLRRPVLEILTPYPLFRPLPALHMLLGASCVWANC